MKQSRDTHRAPTVSGVLALVLFAGNAAWAHNSGPGQDHGGGAQGGSQHESKTKVRARLAALGTPSSDAHGKVERQTKTKSSKLSDRVSAKIEIPCPNPNPGLGIADCTAAESADVKVVLSRLAVGLQLPVPYATCTLQFDQIETEFDDGDTREQAEFRLDVRSKNGVIEFRRGSCDSSQIPDIKSGDSATVQIITAANSEPVLVAEASFNQIASRGKSGH